MPQNPYAGHQFDTPGLGEAADQQLGRNDSFSYSLQLQGKTEKNLVQLFPC